VSPGATWPDRQIVGTDIGRRKSTSTVCRVGQKESTMITGTSACRAGHRTARPAPRAPCGRSRCAACRWRTVRGFWRGSLAGGSG